MKPSTSEPRVCDSCIQRKIKCDQQRPTCSRCRESSRTCKYTRTRRRPGPTQGSHHRRETRHARLPKQQTVQSKSTTTVDVDFDQQQDRDATDALATHLSQSRISSHTDQIDQNYFDVDEATYMQALNYFFDFFGQTLPLFDKEKILSQYAARSYDRNVFDAIVALSLILLKPTNDTNTKAKRYLSRQLCRTSQFEVRYRGLNSLEEFQTECILAFYALHHDSDRRAWARIACLVREAYAVGLHQLDSPQRNLKFDSVAKPDDRGSWKRIWWTIFLLDTCSNMAALTPFVVDLESIRTALCNESNMPADLLYLPYDIHEYPQTIKKLGHAQVVDEMLLGIVLQGLLRYCGNTFRLEIQNPFQPDKRMAQIELLDQVVRDVELVIPKGYTELTQMVFMGEDTSHYRRRLYNVLVLRFCKFFIVATPLLNETVSYKDYCWDKLMDCCTLIVLVFKELTQEAYVGMNPAICFTAACVLCFEEVRTRVDTTGDDKGCLTELSSHKDILTKFLEDFSVHWNVARFLLQAHQNFSVSIPPQLSHNEARVILRVYQGVLHQKWLFPAPASVFDFSNTDLNTGLYQVHADPWFEMLNSIDWVELQEMVNGVNIPDVANE